MKTHILAPGKELDKRFEFLSDLAGKAEHRVLHADMFRQRNMNFALALFAGLIALGTRISGYVAHLLISGTLLLLMIIFTCWDRRWHKTKHGWEATRDMINTKIVELCNDVSATIECQSYYAEGEESAEKRSFQPMVFYFLILASVVSFFIFRVVEGQTF